MHSNHNPYGISFPPGTLKISPQLASISSEVNITGSCNLFCKVRFGGGLQETMPDKKNKRSPSWNQELSFRRKDEDTFKVEVCSPRLFLSPTVVGECYINLENIFTRGHATIKSELYHKGKVTGYLQVKVKWEPDNVRPVYQSAPIHATGYFVNPQTQYTGNHHHVMQRMPSAPPVQNAYNLDNQATLYLQDGNLIIQFPGASTSINRSNSAYPQQSNNSNFRPVGGNISLNQQQLNQSSAINQSSNLANGANLGASRGLNQGQEVVVENEAEEPIDPNLPDEQRCVVCLERKKGGAFYRCGHNCCCVTCGRRFIGAPCPICRQVVLDFIRVFDS